MKAGKIIEIQIEKNVPLTRKGSGRPRTSKFYVRIGDMEIGDSCFFRYQSWMKKIPAEKKKMAQELASVFRCVDFKHMKFTIRSVNDGVRVWRTS